MKKINFDVYFIWWESNDTSDGLSSVWCQAITWTNDNFPIRNPRPAGTHSGPIEGRWLRAGILQIFSNAFFKRNHILIEILPHFVPLVNWQKVSMDAHIKMHHQLIACWMNRRFKGGIIWSTIRMERVDLENYYVMYASTVGIHLFTVKNLGYWSLLNLYCEILCLFFLP